VHCKLKIAIFILGIIIKKFAGASALQKKAATAAMLKAAPDRPGGADGNYSFLFIEIKIPNLLFCPINCLCFETPLQKLQIISYNIYLLLIINKIRIKNLSFEF